MRLELFLSKPKSEVTVTAQGNVRTGNHRVGRDSHLDRLKQYWVNFSVIAKMSGGQNSCGLLNHPDFQDRAIQIVLGGVYRKRTLLTYGNYRKEIAMNALQQSPVGAWLVEVTMPGQAAFPGLLTFNSDGTLMATESPSPFESTGHGSWQMIDDGAVACTFVALFGSAEGKNTGQIKAVGMLHHDDAQVGWTGPFKIKMVDSAGQVTFAESGTFTLTRIAVELLT